MFPEDYEPQQDSEPQPLHIPVPFLNREIGAGDLLKAAIQNTLGVKPCGGCDERRKALNRRVVFNPWAT